MRAAPMHSSRSFLWAAAIVAAFVVSACSQEGWKMDWWNQDQPQNKPKPVTKAQPRPAAESKASQPQTAQAPANADKPAEPDDPQSRELQAKVDRYVQTMRSNPEGGRSYNDFNAKIERQQDPNRKSRVQRVAEQSRENADVGGDSPGAGHMSKEPEARPVAKEVPSEAPKTAVPAGEKEQGTSPVFGSSEPAGRTSEKTAEPDSKPPATIKPSTADESTSVRPSPDEENVVNKPADKDGESSTTSGRPPVLTEITVAPGPEPVAEQPKSSEEPARPTPNIAAQQPSEPVDSLQKQLAEQEARVAREPNNLAEQYRLRMLYLIEGQDEKALAPAEGMDAENQQILQAQIRTLIAARSAAGRDPAARAMELLTPIEELRMQLRAKADLLVPKVVLCTDIAGFGVYKPIEPAQFSAGQKNPVIVYIEVDNFKSEKTPSGLYRTLLSLRPSLLNKSGEELWSATHDNIEDLSRQQRHDFFLTLNETLPASLSPGEYTLKIEVEDVLANKINSNIAKFKIVP